MAVNWLRDFNWYKCIFDWFLLGGLVHVTDSTNLKVQRMTAPDWKVETAIMYYYMGYDLDRIEHNLFVSREGIYRWLKIFGLQKRGYEK